MKTLSTVSSSSLKLLTLRAPGHLAFVRLNPGRSSSGPRIYSKCYLDFKPQSESFLEALTSGFVNLHQALWKLNI